MGKVKVMYVKVMQGYIKDSKVVQKTGLNRVGFLMEETCFYWDIGKNCQKLVYVLQRGVSSGLVMIARWLVMRSADFQPRQMTNDESKCHAQMNVTLLCMM